MDELLKEALLFKDLTDAFTIWEAVLAMVLSFVLNLVIAWVYRRTHKGISYSSSFVHTLVIMGVVVSVIMLIIGSNLARAFSLVGALSIIRFRTAVKDPRDVSFVFLGMAIGMACGTRFYLLAATFTAVMVGIILSLFYLKVGEQKIQEKLLRVSVDKAVNFETLFAKLFSKALVAHRVVEVATTPDGSKNHLSWIIQFAPKSSMHDFLEQVRELSKDDQVQLLSGEDHVSV